MKYVTQKRKSVDEIDDSVNWLDDPYGWWCANNEPILMAIPLQSGNAINLMAALNEAHDAVTDRRFQDAVHSLQVIGSVVIAKAIGRVDDLLDVIASSMADTDMDAELKKLLEEEK
jgi:hypothetical protein